VVRPDRAGRQYPASRQAARSGRCEDGPVWPRWAGSGSGGAFRRGSTGCSRVSGDAVLRIQGESCLLSGLDGLCRQRFLQNQARSSSGRASGSAGIRQPPGPCLSQVCWAGNRNVEGLGADLADDSGHRQAPVTWAIACASRSPTRICAARTRIWGQAVPSRKQSLARKAEDPFLLCQALTGMGTCSPGSGAGRGRAMVWEAQARPADR
jgi:hypothetical protein